DGVYSGSIAFADVDNDNDQDVLITGFTYWNYQLPIAKLYTNDGNGNYTEVMETPIEGVGGGSIAFADTDNDGDQDVLITGEDIEYYVTAKLYTNDGNGNFEKVYGTTFERVWLSSIAFADIDNDNDQDVLITGRPYPLNQGISKLYINEGNNIFEEILDTPFDGVWLGSIAFADVDNDNDQDVLITGRTGPHNGNPISKLYRNLSPLGINENSLFSKVSIFPNPNKGLINIDLGSLNNVSIKVQNLSGQLIYYKENINTPIYQFELDASPGIYILELSSVGEKQQFKLI
ncbi:unnamed protein product, partial [marine sediment metagenome]